MTRIEECENLLSEWKAARDDSYCKREFRDKNTWVNKIKGLEAAIAIIKGPPNTQIQTEEGPCSYCGTHDELETYNLCAECVEALPR